MTYKIAPVVLALLLGTTVVPAFAQPNRSQDTQGERVRTAGVVVSSTGRTMVVRTEDGRHVLFVLNSDTDRPGTLSQGDRVAVVSRPDAEGIQVASRVSTGSGASSQAAAEPIPDDIRELEGQIARQVRRYRAGVRAGVGLDPEIVTAGMHAKLGPFFHPNVWFRPNAEFGIGEVTTMAALNFEAIYRLPITEPQSRWSVYLGAGPGLNFIDRNFEEAQAEERDIDFGDFDFEGSLNILAGIEFRSGMFLEMKTAAYSRPTMRFLVGYSF